MWWFKKAASQLQLLEPDLSFDSVKKIVGEHLPLQLKKMELQDLDMEEASYWWNLLFTDAMLAIENAQGKLFRVATYVTSDWDLAIKALKTVRSTKFQMIRLDMGIDRHWIILTSAKKPHKNDDWVDLLYEQIDKEPSESGSALIKM